VLLNTYQRKENTNILLLGFLGFLSGLLMSCIVFLPSAVLALTTPRIEINSYINNILAALRSGNIFKVLNPN
jgi:F0F1-type ATP synthase assembly protein I